MNLCKINFCISKLFIQCNRFSCCVHITGGVNIYSYIVPVYHACVFVISNQSISKNHGICVKRSVNLIPCCIKHSKVLLVLRYQGSTRFIILTKITHYIWHDYTFSQRNKATKILGEGRVGCWTKFERGVKTTI